MNENFLRLTPYEMLIAFRAIGISSTVLEQKFGFSRYSQWRIMKGGKNYNTTLTYKSVDMMRRFLWENRQKFAELNAVLNKLVEE